MTNFRILLCMILIAIYFPKEKAMENYKFQEIIKKGTQTPFPLKNICLGYILKTHISQNYELASIFQTTLLFDFLEMINKILEIEPNDNLLYKAILKVPELLVVILDLSNVYNAKISQNPISINHWISTRLNNSKEPKEITLIQALLLRKKIDNKLPRINRQITINSLRALLQRGASSYTPHQTPSVLSAAIQHHPEEVALALLEDARDIDVDYQNPLFTACCMNKTEVVKRLLMLGANPDGPRKNGSPLRQAVIINSPKIVELLLENEANPNLGALHIATLYNRTEIITLLEKYGANTKSKWGLSVSEMRSYLNNEWQRLTIEGKTVMIRKKYFKYKQINQA